MKCILMNKEEKVLVAELSSDNNFEEIYEILNIEYAPLCIYNAYYNGSMNNLKELNRWFKGRGIPDFRKDIEVLLKKLNVESQSELLNKAYGLSLSDQYWICEENSKLKWEDINFFTNDFKYKGYLKATFSDSTNENIDLHSPNNTTDGMVSKAWIIEDGKRKLIKGTFTNSRLEPINEWLATQICKELNITCCPYEIDVYDKKLVSKCTNFLDCNEEIITANDIFYLKKKPNNKSDYAHYLSILEEHGIENAKNLLSDMYLVDFLMLNTDRHMKNYGVIRNVTNLKWDRLTPIFDTGNSLCSDKSLIALNFNDGEYKLFTNTNASFNDIIKYINKDRYNINNLKKLPQMLKDKLYEYNYILGINDEYIEKIVNGFSHRINLLENLIYF